MTPSDTVCGSRLAKFAAALVAWAFLGEAVTPLFASGVGIVALGIMIVHR